MTPISALGIAGTHRRRGRPARSRHPRHLDKAKAELDTLDSEAKDIIRDVRPVQH